jgi:hypothetical protein
LIATQIDFFQPVNTREKIMTSNRNIRKCGPLISALFSTILTVLFTGVLPGLALAEDQPEFTIEMKDGAITPERLTVPAGKTVKIIVKNSGSGPAEFESKRLRKERVLSPGAETTLVLKELSAGEYPFFDEFHGDAKPGVIVAE